MNYPRVVCHIIPSNKMSSLQYEIIIPMLLSVALPDAMVKLCDKSKVAHKFLESAKRTGWRCEVAEDLRKAAKINATIERIRTEWEKYVRKDSRRVVKLLLDAMQHHRLVAHRLTCDLLSWDLVWEDAMKYKCPVAKEFSDVWGKRWKIVRKAARAARRI